MNLIKVTQYARHLRIQAAMKYGGTASSYAWRGRDKEGNPVGAFDIALDEARKHDSNDEAIIKVITDYIDKFTKIGGGGYHIDKFYDNYKENGELWEDNKESYKNTANWLKKKVINPAIEDLGYHIVATILKESVSQIKVLIEQIMHITYDPTVNVDFYRHFGENGTMNTEKVQREKGMARPATDIFLKLMLMQDATPVYNLFVQRFGVSDME